VVFRQIRGDLAASSNKEELTGNKQRFSQMLFSTTSTPSELTQNSFVPMPQRTK